MADADTITYSIGPSTVREWKRLAGNKPRCTVSRHLRLRPQNVAVLEGFGPIERHPP